MWSDNETSEDLLGFEVHAKLILELIKEEQLLPLSIGVFGDWGSGKSSILKIINEQLKGDNEELKDDTLVIYFNGWLFEGYDDAKAALLETIIHHFKKNRKLRALVGDEINNLIKSVDWMRVVSLGFKKIIVPAAAAYLTGGLALLPYLAHELKKTDEKELLEKLKGEEGDKFLDGLIKQKKESEEIFQVREFRNDFKKMIDRSKIKKLVVLIDDLDRCTHERIIENLEAIKLFLNVEKTAFIIGADPRIVRYAIEHRYRLSGSTNSQETQEYSYQLITDYLEKLIQIPYNLPRLSDNEVETYMTLLFCKSELKTSYEKVLAEFKKFRTKDRLGIFGYANFEHIIDEKEKAALKDKMSLINSLSSVITEGLKGNPRQIKRFLNTFSLRIKLASVASLPNFKIDILAKLMVLEYAYEDLFKEIYNWQSHQGGEPKELTELEDLAKTEDSIKLPEGLNFHWKDQQVVRWLKAQPILSEIDLRDYFWLSRDRLLSSISGSSLIPAHIRLLFKNLFEQSSDKLLKIKIQKDVSILAPNETSMLITLLSKEILKNPDSQDAHKIFIELMSQKVPGSLISYKNLIKQIDNNKIPFSLRGYFQLAIGQNNEMAVLKDEFSADSKISKALNDTN